MNRVIVQVPMSKKLRDDAEKAVKQQGFSSLQEGIRFLLTHASQGTFSFKVVPEMAEVLSKKDEIRYLRIADEVKAGKNVTKTTSNEELLSYLE